MRPDTILRWHRELLNQRHAATCAPRRRGRQRTVRSIRALVLRLARENRSWGYRRIHGELSALGIKIAASTVWEILKEHGVEPAPGRVQTTWATFLRSQAEALLACDFFETRTLSGARLHVFAVIEHATRRIRILGATAHPTAAWATSGLALHVPAHQAPGKPLGQFRSLAASRCFPPAGAVACSGGRWRVRGVFCGCVPRWACRGGPGSPP